MQNQSYFHDPIYGHIYLSKLERSLVDTIDFQRLRFIRQNSLLHYVFPGAFHTRFSHSIGVCHNSQRLLSQLFPWMKDKHENYCLQVTRIASLLHDVGHGAFSHVLPHVKVKNRSFLPTLDEVVAQPGRWGISTDGDDPVSRGILDSYKDEMHKPIEHEALSLLIIKKMFNEIELNSDVPASTWIQDVSSMIMYKIPTTSKFDDSAIELVKSHVDTIAKTEDSNLNESNIPSGIKSILSSIVSGTIDADRMDYMLRDARECGVNYGLYDYDGVISALKLVVDGDQIVLGFDSKRINTLDDFLWSRYQMFKQIYCHKTHSAYNLLLGRAMNDLAESGTLKTPASLIEYLKLTDDHVMSRVFEEAQSNSYPSFWVKAFTRRQLPKLLGVFESSINDEVWNRSEKEIYSQTQFEKYEGWSNDPDFVTVTLKAEVVRTKSDSRTLPIAVRYDKSSKKYLKESYLNQSVFFQSQLDESLRLEELTNRLNRKLLFFYRLK